VLAVSGHSIGLLERFAAELFAAAGLDNDKAATVAHFLVLTDAMGRPTHGLAMAPLYLAEIEKGRASAGADAGMATTGEVHVIKDSGITAVWDARYLPGHWVMRQAIATAMQRAQQHGLAAIAIRRCHHIGCLAALVKVAADAGCIALIANSEPAGQRVAPFGGTQALFTPNPIALGYPGEPNAVLVDVSTSITTTSMTRQKHAAGEAFEHAWLNDAQGRPTREPAVLEHSQPRGSLQLLGGAEYGHKGFGLSLMVEALSQGLSGHGRLDAPKRWGGNVYLQVMAPRHFAGDEAFAAQTGFLADACRSNPPVVVSKPVRMPGDHAAQNLAAAERDGLQLAPSTQNALTQWAITLNVRTPWK
jgi:LDH2 family malate/lactate/ureidoglycolate dehydrogenase